MFIKGTIVRKFFLSKPKNFTYILWKKKIMKEQLKDFKIINIVRVYTVDLRSFLESCCPISVTPIAYIQRCN